MLEIKNLTKIYKSKKNNECIALNEVGFSLPDKGLVFIIGKSGSGKSTLLNLIAGLDNMTSGEIIVSGNKLSKFSKSDFDRYRSSYIGFIFQDYHLIDSLTVYQNIELSLDISNIEKKSYILDMLKKVDLEGYENRYPKELSGGQQQRVAIARALIKGPSIILGDEPTGNLDRTTSRQILNILKEISKEKLVVIVSHNLSDADEYADRIIELSDGKVISDRKRVNNYENKFKVEEDKLYLPHHKNLSEKEIESILNNKDKIKKVQQIDDGFVDFNGLEDEKNTIIFPKSKLKIDKSLKLFWLFFNRRRLYKFATAFIAALMISVFYVVQSLNSFDGDTALINDIVSNKEQALVVRKSFISEDSGGVSNYYAVAVDDEYEIFKKDYNDNIYKLYNTTIYTTRSSIDNESLTSVVDNNAFYIYETYGTLNCDEDFLIRKYGKNGKLDVLAGDLYNCPYGTIITDYVADSILFFRKDNFSSYEDLIGPYFYGSRQINYISAIIDTDYETKYSKVYDIYKRLIESGDVEYSITSELENEKSYVDFLDEVNKYLGIGYNFSKNYLNDINTTDFRMGYNLYNIYFKCEDIKYYEQKVALYAYPDYQYKEELAPKEIIMSYQRYNSMFGTDYTKDNIDEFVPKEITITKYIARDNKDILYEETFTIVKLHTKGLTTIIVDESDYYNMHIIDHLPYALYLDSPTSTINILNNVKNYNYYVLSNDSKGITTVARGVEIFYGMLEMISLILIVSTILYLASVGTRNIRSNIFEIGVLKALGGRTKDINFIFVLQSFTLGIGILVLSLLGMYIGSIVANEILIASFEIMLKVKFYKLKIVSFYPILVSIDLILALLIIIISSIIPTLYLRKFKPMEILKAKE